MSPLIQSTPVRPRDPEGSFAERVFFNPYITPQISGTIAWRRGELGGSNGDGNTRSLGLCSRSSPVAARSTASDC